MTRVLFLSPVGTDADVDRHADALALLPEIDMLRVAAPTEDRLAHIVRSAASIFHVRNGIDVLITVGTSALTAASIGWRGPLIHILAGKLSRAEASIGRWLSSRSDFRIVTSSVKLAETAATHVVSRNQVAVICPRPVAAALTRDQTRRLLGITQETPLFYIPGRARPGSGHRRSLWTTSILFFRDAATRTLITTGGSADGMVGRFSKSTKQDQALVESVFLNDADRAIAADVAFCTADAAPDWSALAACRAAGTPIVGLRSTWDREQLHEIPAALVDAPVARVIAKAAIEAVEGGRVSIPASGAGAPNISSWLQLLRSAGVV